MFLYNKNKYTSNRVIITDVTILFYSFQIKLLKFIFRHFNFICRTVQIKKKNSRFAVRNSQPARQ